MHTDRTLVATLVLPSLLLACESDVVRTNPPPESELQPGRVLSDEKVYINEDGTGNFRAHCKESHVNNDDPLLYPS